MSGYQRGLARCDADTLTVAYYDLEPMTRVPAPDLALEMLSTQDDPQQRPQIHMQVVLLTVLLCCVLPNH